MDNSSTRRRREIETLSLELRKYPTDLLHSFLPTSPNTTLRRRSPEPEKEEDGEILNLGLSLGGRFGVDKTHKGLVRSSSVAGAMPLIREEAAPRLPLVRTASLPTDAEEECRRWKELQSLRSMEAKRKRSEKQRGINENGLGPAENLNLNPGSGYPVLWAAESVVKGGFCDDLQSLVMQQQKQDGSQGSDESQGGSKSSSNASETDIKTHPGSCSGTRSSEVSSKKQLDASNNQKKARICGDGIGDMPCVFTVGDGPRGRKVEGILYRYKKGEEVRIMCVCHGSFFTPAEFVNHAGARNVAHPLKRIVVNPTASPFS